MNRVLCANTVLIMVVLCSGLTAHAAGIRSIREWVAGDGKTDDALGVAKAFDACKNNAFTLQVDCPVFIHVGRDIARPIFVDNGTHVLFTKTGLFITDDVLLPAFVIVNSSDVQFLNWNVEYLGGLPMDRNLGGYVNNGAPVNSNNPSSAFNDLTLPLWLASHRGIKFGGAGSRTAPWHGPTNMSAMFYFMGSASHVDIEDMKLFAPPKAGGHQFIPMAFSLTFGYDSNTTAVKPPASGSWMDVPNISIPNNITFKNIVLDGYYMGFQGQLQDSTFTNIAGLRYGDLQDANGNDVGGDGKWFAPPHLFYLNPPDKLRPYDERLCNKNLSISNVFDVGPRVGRARDTSALKRSGYANSLKIGAVNSTVTNYSSNRVVYDCSV